MDLKTLLGNKQGDLMAVVDDRAVLHHTTIITTVLNKTLLPDQVAIMLLGGRPTKYQCLNNTLIKTNEWKCLR